ncbi:MAG: matrixin family metalloprotease, partial [Sideroxydans sp.]|nr:matrixin family metalloprotease [Sideroxydans sp.]
MIRSKIIGLAMLLVITISFVTDAVAVSENNSSLTPLISQAVALAASKELTFGVCQLVPNLTYLPVGMEHALIPAAIAVTDLARFSIMSMPKGQSAKVLTALELSAKATVLQQPKYGTLSDTAKRDVSAPEPNLYFYNPKSGYMGKDQVIFLVEVGEYKIRLIYNIYPVAGSPENPEAIARLCGKRGQNYKIAAASDQSISGLIAAQLSGQLATSGITLNFADLTGGALGQTTGSSITLDTTAAGNNWYIDTTPSDNSEYLPTSNPNEWVAKAGSADATTSHSTKLANNASQVAGYAAGKMDMLSVLLHEYGHALGIDHNTDAHDYMGATLTAGIRRLPTTDEMALTQQLIASLLPSPTGRGTEVTNDLAGVVGQPSQMASSSISEGATVA